MKELEVPEGWARARVDRVATVAARIGWKALTASEYVDEGYAFLSTPNIKHASIDFHNVNYITEFRYRESPELALRSGDVLLAKDGNTLGITNIVAELPRPATVNGSIAVLRAFNVEPRFLRYSLDGSLVQGLIEAFRSGMGVPHLFQFDINRLPVLLPPMVEQRKIADYLDTETARIDALIAKKQRLAERLGERRSGVIDRFFGQQPICPKLSRLLIQRPCYGVLKPDRYEGPGAVPCIRISEIRSSGELDLSEAITISPMQHAEYRRTRLKGGDVLVSCVGTLGRAAVVGEDAAGANVSRAVARLVPLLGLDPGYLGLWTESSEFRRAVDLVVNITAQPVLNMGDLASMKVPMPDNLGDTRQLSADIGAALAPMEEARAKLARQMTLLKEHRQALITAAVTGELEVPGVAA